MSEDGKRCWHCNKVKSRDRFCHDRSHSDGLSSRCKDCDPIIAAERHHRTMKYRDSYKQGRCKVQKGYRERYPEKVRAHRIARKVPLASACTNCGGTKGLHKHHPDYSKPLEVVTLCAPCHREVHHG